MIKKIIALLMFSLAFIIGFGLIQDSLKHIGLFGTIMVFVLALLSIIIEEKIMTSKK